MKVIEINLLPEELRPAPLVRWLPPYLALLYSLAVFLILWSFFSFHGKIASLRSDIASIQQSLEALKPFDEAYEVAKEGFKELEDMKRIFNVLDAHYVDWPLFLAKLNSLVPPNIWLTSVDTQVLKSEVRASEEKEKEKKESKSKKKERVMLMHEGSIEISGSTRVPDMSPISGFIENLRSDPFFIAPRLSSAAFTSLNRARYDFVIVTRVKHPEEEKKQAQNEHEEEKG